jgi:cyanophycin synthetase
VARGIPFRRLTSGSLVQLGWGSKARRIQAAELDATSAVAESIAQDKDLTKRLLHAAGVPVPLGRPVTDVEDAWKVAEEVGLPVVVKPQDGNQGKGVVVNITTARAAAGAGRRPAHYFAAGGHRQPGSAPRQRPRHGAHQGAAGRHRRRAHRRRGPHA